MGVLPLELISLLHGDISNSVLADVSFATDRACVHQTTNLSQLLGCQRSIRSIGDIGSDGVIGWQGKVHVVEVKVIVVVLLGLVLNLFFIRVGQEKGILVTLAERVQARVFLGHCALGPVSMEFEGMKDGWD